MCILIFLTKKKKQKIFKMQNIDEINNEEKVQKIQDKLCANMLNLRTAMYSFLFKQAK